MIPETFTEHPAEYTKGILEGVEERGWLPFEGRIIDPFGGAGRRLHEVLSRPGRELVAVEIELAFVQRWPEYLTLGDATALPFEDASFEGAVTSPPYAGVRFSDYDRPRAPKNWKGRRGYDLSAKFLTGDETYTLNARNAAKWVAASGTDEKYWRLCEAAWREVARVLMPGAPFVFNYKPGSGAPDSGKRHMVLLRSAGFELRDHFVVGTRGYGFGANGDKRDVVGERVVLLERLEER